MIKTRSTYQFTYNLDLTFDTIIDIYIWQGDVLAKPLTPQYTITDTNPIAQVSTQINITNLINDFINFTPISGLTTGLIDNPNSVYVSIDRTVDGVTTNELEEIAIQGYYSAIEGLNIGLPANKILVNGDYMKANKNSSVVIPLNPDGTNVTVISYPSNEINLNIPVPVSTDTNDYFKALWIDLNDITNDTYIEIIYNAETYIIDVIDECKYQPVDIHFVNKEGQQQSLTFFKERKDNTESDKEQYQRAGVVVTNGEPQFKDYNINGKSSFSINSDFVEESQNESFKQLLLSENIWQFINGKFTPLNLEDKNIEYQTRINDKLIKYNLEFSYSFNDINTL